MLRRMLLSLSFLSWHWSWGFRWFGFSPGNAYVRSTAWHRCSGQPSAHGDDDAHAKWACRLNRWK